MTPANYYLTVITGTLKVTNAGNYEISVDGDDAVEVIVDNQVVAGWYGGHGNCGTATSCRDDHKGSITLGSGDHTLVFRHQERTGGDNYFLYWKGQDSLNAWQIVPADHLSGLVQKVYNVTLPASTRTDYVVRVKACVSGLLEPECKGYPQDTPTVHKPIGLLHDYGETDRMAFGLLTGSYEKHLSGGVLRKNISSFKDEVDAATGQFIVPTGGSIRKTIDGLAVIGFDYGSHSYTDGSCKVPMTSPMQEGRCAMWGNPVAEMMYEGVRYFAGKTGPTSAFSISNTGNFDAALGLPKPDWLNPYRAPASGGYVHCSRPFQIVISDAPSFDTDQLPGSYFNSFTGDLSPALDVQTRANTIWAGETEANKVFIGQSGATYDGAPTPKDVSSFGDIRGLAPEEPTRQGGYYAASVANYARTEDLNAATGDQKMDTFAVALSSPLPRIEIPMENSKTITLVPFAKSVGQVGTCLNNASDRPTNTIVDFYVDKIVNTGTGNQEPATNSGRPYGKFRINYEDSEYGSDHDMDAIVTYEVMRNANNTLTVNLSSDYAAGCIIQHMGYVISGTTADGVYLEVRDLDTSTGNDANADYFLDTPPTFVGIPPAPATAAGWQDAAALPLTASRTFSPGTSPSAAFIKHDPLWYAAKWGGFVENKNDSNNQPDKQSEWDADNDGKPDSYFFVTNAGKLKEQLSASFQEIIARTGSAASVATNSTSLQASSRIFQASFDSKEWSGNLKSFKLNSDGGIIQPFEWDAGQIINTQAPSSRTIITYSRDSSDGIPFTWTAIASLTTNTTQKDALNANGKGVTDGDGSRRVSYLRGDASNEGLAATNFRKRSTSKLGDIVNSNPWYVGAPQAGYPGSTYLAFRTTYFDRTPIIYAGANDGMLHGFNVKVDSSTNLPATGAGEEMIAYVPSQMYANLSKLTDLNYSHRYFVDGSPMVGDADVSGWKTVLVGGLNAGGQGYYALDVTNPADFSETNAGSLVLWEFTDKDDPDLGYTFNQPMQLSDDQPVAAQIRKMANNKWAVIVGNGYNNTEVDDNGGCTDSPDVKPCTVSQTGHAVLYILFIADGMDGTWTAGADFIKIDTGTGTTASPNGLATPVPVDIDGDDVVDYIYAGDLQGNLWKFDVKDSSPTAWKVAFGTTLAPLPLFTAVDSATPTPNPQPITSAPTVTPHPDGGFMVNFGTGKYLEVNDIDPNKVPYKTQTLYGVWDKDDGTTTITGRTELVEQTVLSTLTTASGQKFRITSQNAVNFNSKKGWYLDLPSSSTTGERVAYNPLLRFGRSIFTTLIPSDYPCDAGGTSWVMELDYLTGGRLDASPFDVNGDEKFNEADLQDLTTGSGTIKAAVSGMQLGSSVGGGIAPTPAIIKGCKGGECKEASLSSGAIESVGESVPPGEQGRINWRELIK